MSDALIEALRALPTPTPPPVERLLELACPPATARRPRVTAAVLTAASISAASLPLILPASEKARAWGEGLALRGQQWSNAVVETLGEEQR